MRQGRAAWLLVAMLAAGCGRVIDLNVRLVTRTCEEARGAPLEGVTRLQITVYGEGIQPSPRRVPVSQKSLDLPVLPGGSRPNIVVEGLQDEAVVARGETGPLDLDSLDDPATVAIFLRRTDTFTPVGTPEGSAACSHLLQARAGHTATLLGDGRVLIAGGFHEIDNARVYYPTTEIFDPRTGTVVAGPDLYPARAFHVAAHIPGTNFTVLAGGEGQGDALRALRLAEVYDEKTNKFRTIPLFDHGRVRHAAAVSATTKRLVLAGGYDGDGAPRATTEVFDPEYMLFRPGPELPAPRAELSAAALPDGRVLVAGGFDGEHPVGRLELLVPEEDGFRLSDASISSPVPRLSPLLAPLGTQGAAIAGGLTDRDTQEPYRLATEKLELVALESHTVTAATANLRSRRGDGGIVPLPDGTAIVGGGAKVDGSGRRVALDDADVLAPADERGTDVVVRAATGSLRDARYLAAWTLLADGTVLVTGGIYSGAAGGRQYLDTAEVYQPRYQSSSESPYR